MDPATSPADRVPPARAGRFRVSPEVEAKIDALLGRMTLAEKLGQLTQFAGSDATGPLGGSKVDQLDLIRRGGIGSILNRSGAAELNGLQRVAVQESRLGIPILFGLDVIHGYRTVFPVPLGMAASWDAALAEQCARVAAEEATADGLRWTFSPMLDIARDARWGRITEGSGEDPHLASVLAAGWVRGYQGGDLASPTSLLACAKHFVAYGAAQGGRDYDAVEVSERSLRETYFPPFQAAIEAGVASVMSSFNTINGVPATANQPLLTDVLRGAWSFNGLVVSDWDAVSELIVHGLALDGATAARQAIVAGVDMDMVSNHFATGLPAQVEAGRVPIERIDEAVRRVLRVKFALGLFERPYADESRAPDAFLTSPAVELAREAAEASFVLLKNDAVDGTPLLPLRSDRTVALIGELADSADDMLGAWTLRGRAEDVVTLRAAMAQRLGERLIWSPGVGPTGEADDGFGDPLAAATKADVVVMALGESRAMSGEAQSRSSLDLPGRQRELLKVIVATGKPVVLVLFSGRPLALAWEAAHVPSILAAWFPGTQAGPALVRTLFGDVNPSGKLTASFPRSVGQMPLYYNALNTGRPATGREPGDGYITGYRDERNTALYPFGHGLSYTRFDYSPTRLSRGDVTVDDLARGETLRVTTTVRNVGDRAGKEIVQLYIGLRGTSVARPVRELKGFEIVWLAPGESREVSFALTRHDLSFWDARLRQVVEPCELTIWVGPSSVAGEPARVQIRGSGRV